MPKVESVVSLKADVQKIKQAAFKSNKNIKEIFIKSKVTTIEDSAFASCTNLKEVTFNGNDLTSMGKEIFRECTALTTIQLPSQLGSIGQGMFRSCTSLSSINIPNTVESILIDAFSRCTALTSITLPNKSDNDNVLRIGTGAFSYSGLTSITLPKRIIFDVATDSAIFANCKSLTEVKFTEGTTLNNIPRSMFYNCSALKTIELPESIQTIGIRAFSCDNNFSNANKIEEFTIPNSVSEIKDSAFCNAANLKTITFEEGNQNAITMGRHAFYNIDPNAEIENYNHRVPTINAGVELFGSQATGQMTLKVPCSVVNKYKNSVWGLSYFSLDSQIQVLNKKDEVSVVYEDMQIPKDVVGTCETKLTSTVTIMPNASLSFEPLVTNMSETSSEYDAVMQQVKAVQFNIQKELKFDTWNLVAKQFIENTYDVFNSNKGNNSGLVHDIAALPFDYSTNNWFNGWKTYTESLPESDQSLFVWPFSNYIVKQDSEGKLIQETDANTNTTYRPTEEINNTDDYTILSMIIPNAWESGNRFMDIPKNTSTNNLSNGRAFALYNPYVGRLSVKKFINRNIDKFQGKMVYIYNGSDWSHLGSDDDVLIAPGEGFMVCSASNEQHLAPVFCPGDIHDLDGVSTNNKSDKLNKIVFTSKANDSERSMWAMMNENSENVFDINDGFIMFSNNREDLVEPYFTLEGKRLVQNAFKTLPYETEIGFHASKYSNVEFGVDNVPADIEVTLIDKKAGNKQTIISDGTKYKFNVLEGENTGRFVVKFSKKNIGINETNAQNSDISINTTNNEIFIDGSNLKNLQIINTLGQVIKEEKLSGNTYQTTLDLPGGAYIIKVISNNSSSTKKVVIK